MSRSESLESEVRIRCFSSTIAKCEDSEEEVEDLKGAVVVWFGGLEGFEDLIPELIFDFCNLITIPDFFFSVFSFFFFLVFFFRMQVKKFENNNGGCGVALAPNTSKQGVCEN